MIIFDRADQIPLKVDSIDGSTTTVRLPERVSVAARSTLSLPDYETSQALHIDFRKPKKNLFGSPRFRKWLFTAMTIYVIVTIAVGVPLLVTKLKKVKSQAPSSPWENNEEPPSSVNLALNPSKFSLDSSNYPCDQWQAVSDPLSSFASHLLQPSGTIFIRSNASFENIESRGIAGNLTFDINPDPAATLVQASMAVVASNTSLLRQIHICFMDDDVNRGLSLYVPQKLETETLNFIITILFPQSAISGMNDLYTSLPTFTQHFGDLSRIPFNNVVILGSQGKITSDSISAKQISITTSLASVTGNFTVSQAINLDNIGGGIDIDVTLTHLRTQKAPTFFSVESGNSAIRANITLKGDTAPTDKILAFTGQVKNFNGNVEVGVVHDPSSAASSIDLRVQNSAGSSKVSLGPQFSGFLDAQTKMGKVQLNSKLVKPSRIKSIQTDTTHFRGYIGSQQPKTYTPDVGKVEIFSSLGNVWVDLLPNLAGRLR